MGGGSWKSSDFHSYAKSSNYSQKTVDQIYTHRHLHKDLDPKSIKVRESCDSKDNPNSTPIILGLDVTGSMEPVLDTVARHGLNTTATEIHNRKPVSDPHFMCMGIGDLDCDQSPLQVTQFEADLRILHQLEKIWLERHGGGNNYEGYALAWYFAAKFTKTDSWDKRQKKGYLFTVGDEMPTPSLNAARLSALFGKQIKDVPTVRELYQEVSKKWEVFHLMVEEGNYFRENGDQVVKEWTSLIGQRAIRLHKVDKLAEILISTIEIREGRDPDEVAASWGPGAHILASAIEALRPLRKVEV